MPPRTTTPLFMLKLEAIGDQHRTMAIAVRRNPTAHGSWRPPRRIAPGVLRGPWVAEVTGLDAAGRISREFLSPFKDYTHATSSGSRGIWHTWALIPGCYYEVHEVLSFTRTERYFGKIVDGAFIRVPVEEVMAWWLRP